MSVLGNYAVSVVFFVVGLSLLDVLSLSWAVPDASRWRARGLPAALGLGLIFGIALGPCTFAYLAPMLAVVFAAGREHLGYGLLLIGAYGVGHCTVIVAAGTTTEWVTLSALERTRGRRRAPATPLRGARACRRTLVHLHGARPRTTSSPSLRG